MSKQNVLGIILATLGLMVFISVGIEQVFSGDVFNGLCNIVIGMLITWVGWKGISYE